MTNPLNVKQCIATLNGIQAQLSTLAIQFQDEVAQKAFHESMLTVEEIQKDLYKWLVEIQKEKP
ncbi:DUF1657 domain-containing protein [Niallia sp. XMNu-256]|uniref:DUF1657 domain-containing protein n=1 Tax=Niallia sp. XMNu-256 TaxID=3082444 RepID=UPI0030D3DD80